MFFFHVAYFEHLAMLNDASAWQGELGYITTSLNTNLSAGGVYKITGLVPGDSAGDSVEYDQFTTALSGKANSSDLAGKLDANGGTWTPGYLGGNLDADGYKIIGLQNGSDPYDAVNMSQLNAAVQGLDQKADVYVACSSNITISSPGSTLDGVTFNNPADIGKRVALVGQTSGAQNGIYEWNGASSAMTRASDSDDSSKVTTGMAFSVQSGTNAGKLYRLNTSGTITLGTTALDFLVFSQVQLSNDPPEDLAASADSGTSAQASRADHKHSTAGLVLADGTGLTAPLQMQGQVISLGQVGNTDALQVSNGLNIVNASGGNWTGTFPSGAVDGAVVAVKRLDETSNTAVISRAGSDLIQQKVGGTGTTFSLNKGDSYKFVYISGISTWVIF